MFIIASPVPVQQAIRKARQREADGEAVSKQYLGVIDS
jgi:hypothetical protein